MINDIQGLTQKVNLISQQKLCKLEGNGMIYLKQWNRRDYNQEYSTQWGAYSDLMEKSRALKVKRIQHLQVSFTTNAEETFRGRKHKRRKRPKKKTTPQPPAAARALTTENWVHLVAHVNSMHLIIL